MVEPRKFNAVEEDIAPPLNVTIDGVEYPVGGKNRSVTTEMLVACDKTAKDNPESADTLAEGLGILLRVPAKTFKETDFRVLSSTLRWIQGEIIPDIKKVGGTKKIQKKKTGGQGKN